MEKYAKKAKITVPALKVKGSFNKRKTFITLAIMAQFIAFLTPWLWQKYVLAITQRSHRIYKEEAWLWSFMAIVKPFWNGWQVWLFCDYWFNLDMIFNLSFSPKFSLFIFVFQILTIISIFLIIKKGGFNNRLKILAPLLLSISTSFFCILRFHEQSLNISSQIQPYIGFWSALLSSLLFVLSFIFYKRENTN